MGHDIGLFPQYRVGLWVSTCFLLLERKESCMHNKSQQHGFQIHVHYICIRIQAVSNLHVLAILKAAALKFVYIHVVTNTTKAPASR